MSVIQLPSEQVIEIATGDLGALKAAALRARSRRARFNLHPGNDSAVHDMVIAFAGGGYVRPHRHYRKAESFHAIEGDFDVVLFADGGRPSQVVRMGPIERGRTFIYRLPENRWHTVIPRSEMIVLHEITPGPFRPEETEFAPWAPTGEDPAAALEWVRELEAQLTGSG